MFKLLLNGQWKMKKITDTDWIRANVPGSIMADFLNCGKIGDPFYRDNEDEAKEIASYDYVYNREFQVDSQLLKKNKILLFTEGIDTLSEIRINDIFVANTNNMHRTFEFDIKEMLKEGCNTIEIILFSPVKFIEKKHKENPIWGGGDSIQGFPHLRKGHYMFGWDWGPQIPDLGIWRDIFIIGYDCARLKDVYITQKHENGSVSIDIHVENEYFENAIVEFDAVVTSSDGNRFSKSITTEKRNNNMIIDIIDPKIWWPNGFGEHPLYSVEITLKKTGVLLDTKTLNIGLRTLKVKREKDQWGESFEFYVNGVSIFAMGANYIPEDNLLSRCNPEKTERLIRDCIEANFNCIRVWGGGIYPEDYFFDLCDKYGIIVWQDLMYACAVYEMTDEFTANIKKETEDNVRRIRHHASLGLWCGNNEMEWGWEEWDFPKTPKLRTDYIKQFEILFPQTIKEVDPNTLYWPASPSSGGSFDNPNDENRGDVHYWEVWHGLKPFTDYRKYNFRFVSEFGFQSFPCLKTIETFTLPEDRNVFSYIMEKHQKNNDANGKILHYLSTNFKYPKDFVSLLYASQLLQAEAIKYGVEHWRRNRGRCMGAMYWQLNDCWPVASWSSIDSFGRWKALHYFAKKFFAPVLLSANDEGDRVQLHITNETLNPVRGEVLWKLRDNKSEVLMEGSTITDIDSLSASICVTLDFSEKLKTKQEKRTTYVEYSLILDKSYISSNAILFVNAKHFEYLKPDIHVDVKELEDRFEICLQSNVFAQYVELALEEMDCVFSDNYFHISAGTEKHIELDKKRILKNVSADDIAKSLLIRSIYDIA